MHDVLKIVSDLQLFNLRFAFAQLGTGSNNSLLSPPAADIASGYTSTQLRCGNHYVCTLTASGGVRCWGSNGAGQVGNGKEHRSSS